MQLQRVASARHQIVETTILSEALFPNPNKPMLISGFQHLRHTGCRSPCFKSFILYLARCFGLCFLSVGSSLKSPLHHYLDGGVVTPHRVGNVAHLRATAMPFRFRRFFSSQPRRPVSHHKEEGFSVYRSHIDRMSRVLNSGSRYPP